MKKMYIFVIITVMCALMPTYARVGLFIDFTANTLNPADTGYAKIFGETIFYPEVMTGVKIYKDFYIYGAYGFLNIKGNVLNAESGVRATSNQNFISLGMGYEFMSDKIISIKISGGVIFVNYSGKAYLSDSLIDDDSGARIGYKFDIGAFYHLTEHINVGVVTGYFHAQNTKDYSRKLSYGGLKSGISLSIRLK